MEDITNTTDVQQEGTGTDTPQEPQEAPVSVASDMDAQQESAGEETPQDAQNTLENAGDGNLTPMAFAYEEPAPEVAPMMAETEGAAEAATNAVDCLQSASVASAAYTAEMAETDEETDTLQVRTLDVVKIGRQGENGTQVVVIDASAWLDELPGCTMTVAAIRPGENTVYLPEIRVEGGVITWPITGDDTANAGWGRGEIRAQLGEKVKKSAVFRTRVEPSLEAPGEGLPPAPPGWAQEILQAVKAASASAEAAQEQATNAAAQATTAKAQAAAAAASVQGLAGWSLMQNTDGTVSIDYTPDRGKPQG